MERNAENDKILLVGEANFSFSLSLSEYLNPKLITTTCYESKVEAMRKYGADLVLANESKLREQNFNQILYEIDACKLEKSFPSQKFNRIIFMFPHVGGKSNLKKNRQLLNDFFASAKQVLDVNDHRAKFDCLAEAINAEDHHVSINNNKHRSSAAVFVTLAQGQGGSSFEADPTKRNIKDCWQIVPIAHSNGFIMTECFNLDLTKYSYYKSTGFRNQSRSFQTNYNLVHKFELSLPLDDYDSIVRYFKFSNYLINQEIKTTTTKTNHQHHPIVQLKRNLLDHLSRFVPNLKINNIIDSFQYHFKRINHRQKILSNEFESNIKIDAELLVIIGKLIETKDLNFLDSDNSTMISLRKSIQETFENIKSPMRTDIIKPKQLNVISGLSLNPDLLDQLIKTNPADLLVSIELSHLNSLFSHQILIHFNGGGDDSDDYIDKIQQHLIEFVQSYSNNNNSNTDHLIQLHRCGAELIGCLNTDRILKEHLKLLDDEVRLIYSSDKRTGHINDALKSPSIENLTWTHDLSFWYDPTCFSMKQLLIAIMNHGQNQVVRLELIDKYSEQSTPTSTSNAQRHSACYRLYYRSIDKALSFDESNKLINSRIRDQLTKFSFLTIR